MKPNRHVGALLLPLLLAAGEAFAQPSSDPRLEKLEETVRMLERRVTALEQQLRQRSALAPIPADKTNWRKLQKGMSEGEVERILGSPTKVDALGPFITWYYGDLVAGQVRFDGRSRMVFGWVEP